MTHRLDEIVNVQHGFKAAVDISRDLEDENKIKGYIPTENGVKVIEQVFEYLKPHTATRPIILTGTYGTGKSHLGLVVATLLRKKLEDEVYKSLFAKIESKWRSTADKIKGVKKNYGENPYLLVYLEAEEVDWGPGFFNNSLILALKKALKREGLEDIAPVTAYDRALSRIQEIKNNYPDAYRQLEREIANKEYYSVENIKNKLHKHKKRALEDFAEIHEKVSAGASFDWFSGVIASDAYIATVEALRERDYKGILLVWDEFTPVLRKLVEDPLGGEATAFQKFAQTCDEASANKIISIFISIRDIQDVIDRVIIESLHGEGLIQDAEKISGRFRVMRLGRIDTETYHLMKGVIIHKDIFDEIKIKHNERFLEIRNSVDELNLFYEYRLVNEDKRIITEDLYPLHPLTTLVLSRLTDRVGQRERTIFTFLCDSGEGTFGDFLKREEVTAIHLPFLYPFELESYFLPLIRQNLEYKELRRLTRKYEEVMASLSPDDEIGKKIIKTIFLLNAAVVRSTTANILFALGCFTGGARQDIEDRLETLKDERKITQKISDRTWRFFGQSLDVAMDDHIREAINEIRVTPKELFNETLDVVGIKTIYCSVVSENYNIDRNIERKIELEFITTKELDNPDGLRKKIREKYIDGRYYFILADTEEEISDAEKKILNYFSDDVNVLFALPANIGLFYEIIPPLKKLKALEKLPSKYPQYKSELRDELSIEEDDTKRFLRIRLEELLDPSKGHIKFYYRGARRDVKAVNRLRELVSEMMENTFPYTPSIAREELIKEDGHDTWRAKYRIPLINTVLSPKAPSLLIAETDAVKKHIIEAVYKHHNIFRQEAGKWIIKKPRSSPNDNAMIKIWEEIENFIKTDTFKKFSELIKILRMPPYGLKRRTIGLILASVLREYTLHNNLILELSGYPVEKIDGELIEDRIILKSQQIKVRFQGITEKHKVILSAVADVFGSNETDLESIYRTVVNWWRDLPQYSRTTNKISKQAKKLKQSFFEPLSTQEKDKRELFYSILPNSIGIDDFNRETNEQVGIITHKMLEQIKNEFENLILKLHEEIESAIVGVFGEKYILLAYYPNFSEDVRNHIFTGDAKKLIDWLKNVHSKKELQSDDFVGLAENIRGKCTNWNDEQVSVLKGHLESAKNQIESYTHIAPPIPSEVEDLKHIERERRKNLKIGNVERVFTLYENLDEAPNKEQVQILLNVLRRGLLPPLENEQITADEFLSIIYHLIKEIDNA